MMGIRRSFGRTAVLASRCGALEYRLDTLDRRSDMLESRLESLDRRIDAVDHRSGALEANAEQMLAAISALGECVVVAEREALQIAVALTSSRRREAAVGRLFRIGATRIAVLTSATDRLRHLHGEGHEAIGRLNTKLDALAKRIDVDAAESRRVAEALFETIKTRTASS